jgi:hypothetical protein
MNRMEVKYTNTSASASPFAFAEVL